MNIIDYKSEFGLEVKKDITYVDSRYVAEFLGKRHTHLLDTIKKILSDNSGYSKYTDKSGKTNPMYLMTRDGFMILVMSYNTKSANTIKEMYIKRFNEMESYINSLKICRADFPKLTENIKLAYCDDIKPYHYTNEVNMINRIVLGKTAQQFRKDNNISDKSIRPYLNEYELEQIDYLQLIDSGLVLGVNDYNTRKMILENYYLKKYKGGE